MSNWSRIEDFYKDALENGEEVLFGPKAKFMAWVDGSDANDVKILEEVMNHRRFANFHNASLIAKISRLRLSLSVDFQELRESLHGSEEKVIPASLTPAVVNAYEGYAERLRSECKDPKTRKSIVPSDPSQWTLADWRILSLLQDRYTLKKSSTRIIERTPIFFAYNNGISEYGKVFFLAAERLDGPSMVTPDWWRIGFLNVDRFAVEVNKTLSFILQQNRTPFHIRWWLEIYNQNMRWNEIHEAIDSADSNTASAACLGMALLERESPEEPKLLDELAGVSAVVDSLQFTPGTPLEEVPVGKVEGFKSKFNAAISTGKISTILAHQDSIDGYSSQNGVEIQPVKTLGEVYHALTDSMQDYRLAVAERWGRFLEELPGRYHNPNPSGKRFEVATGQEYIDASNKR